MGTISQIGSRRRAMFFKQVAGGEVDIYPTGNAASFGGNEANALPTLTGDTFKTTASVNSVDFEDGIYSLEFECITIQTGKFLTLTVAVESGKTYEVSVFGKRSGTNDARILLRAPFSAPASGGYLYITETANFALYTVTATATATGSAEIRFYTSNDGQINEKMWIDGFKIIEQ